MKVIAKTLKNVANESLIKWSKTFRCEEQKPMLESVSM